MGWKAVQAQVSEQHAERVEVSLRDVETGAEQTITTTLTHPFFVQTTRQVARTSGGHVYSGPLADGYWVDAGDLLADDRLLNDDGSWAEVVSSDVSAEPLRAYNLTVEGWHTYFVAANVDAAPVWVHNWCGSPKLRKIADRRFASKADEIRATPGGAVGKEFDVGNGGKVFVEGAPANAHELDLAVEIASTTGGKVVVRGAKSNVGDYLIDGVAVEIKSFRSNTASALQNSLGDAVFQAQNVVLDGRKVPGFSGTSKGTALSGLRRWINGPKFNPKAVVTIYTTGGRVRYIPGKGVIKN
jgi:filamentous hemagglutinin